MDSEKKETLIFIIDGILTQPLENNTKNLFIQYKNKLLDSSYTINENHLNYLNQILELQNKEMEAVLGLMQIQEETTAADILTKMKRKDIDDIFNNREKKRVRE